MNFHFLTKSESELSLFDKKWKFTFTFWQKGSLHPLVVGLKKGFLLGSLCSRPSHSLLSPSFPHCLFTRLNEQWVHCARWVPENVWADPMSGESLNRAPDLRCSNVLRDIRFFIQTFFKVPEMRNSFTPMQSTSVEWKKLCRAITG